MNEPSEIHSARLHLRAITPFFISNLFSTKSSDDIKAFFQCDHDEFEILKSMNDKGLETFRISLYYFLLSDKATNQIIGECGFHTWNISHNRAEIFYKLKDEQWKNKGYMTEALNEVLTFGFKNLNLHRVQALVAHDNIPSLRLLSKFGFQKEGTLREDYLVDGKFEDSECYSLIKHEWKM
jgi:ribosomal-protein-alanine N-acetyltransferase